TIMQIFSRNRTGTACAFRDVLAGHFNMNTTGMCSLCAMNSKEALNLLQNVIEWPRLVPAGCDCIAMHWIAGPHNLAAFPLYSTDQLRQVIFNFIVSKTSNKCQAPRLVFRIEQVNQPDEIIGFK